MMKNARWTYETQIDFGGMVREHSFKLRCLPFRCEYQRIEAEDFSVSPSEWVCRGRDCFGNELIYGGAMSAHKNFVFASSGIVSLKQFLEVGESAPVFRMPTRLTTVSREMKRFAYSVAQFDDDNIVAATMEIVSALGEKIKYEPFSTTVNTSAAEAFALGKGVCQDFAHIVLAILRSEGVPCRYVCGFVPGEGESHAWIEVNEGGVWYSIDPTRQTMIESGYIKVAQGRDFADCSMERGVYKGEWKQFKEIHISVSEI